MIKKINDKMNALACKIFGHEYTILRIIGDDIRELKCSTCGAEFGMNDEVQAVIPLTDELRGLHDRYWVMKRVTENDWDWDKINELNDWKQ